MIKLSNNLLPRERVKSSILRFHYSTKVGEAQSDVRARKPRLPGARFLEECRGQQGGSRGDLSGGVGSPMLKPPGDGFHKQRRHQVWYKLIREGVDSPRVRVRSVRKVPTLLDQASKIRTHLPHKPGAALAAEQRS